MSSKNFSIEERVEKIVNDRTIYRGRLTSFVLLLLGILAIAISMPWLLQGELTYLFRFVGFMFIIVSIINILSVRLLVGKPIRIRKN